MLTYPNTATNGVARPRSSSPSNYSNCLRGISSFAPAYCVILKSMAPEP